MTRIAKLYDQVRGGGNPSFNELCRLAEAFGFKLMRTNGSHHIYQHPDVPGNLNFQPTGKDAKPYQVRQFLALINDENLHILEQ
jgi:predicted RNA binding protein YcfA (HicA-like mRNA interferase family)